MRDNTEIKIKNHIEMLKQDIEKSKKIELGLVTGSLACLATTLVFFPAIIFGQRVPINYANELLEDRGYQSYVESKVTEYYIQYYRGEITQSELDSLIEHYNHLSAGREFLVSQGFKSDVEKFDGYLKQNEIIRYSLGGIATAVLGCGIISCSISFYFGSRVKKDEKELKELEMICKPQKDNRRRKYPAIEVRFEEVKEDNKEDKYLD